VARCVVKKKGGGVDVPETGSNGATRTD
jgi:hypothetical protein